MSQSVLLIGGAGHLGSCLNVELTRSGFDVCVLDLLLYSDENKGTVDIESDIFSHKFDNISEFDKVFWIVDIDCEDFYITELSQKYIKINIEKFTEFAKKFKNNFYFISDFYLGNNITYQKFIADKRNICRKYGCTFYGIPCLYGASPRMRFDTFLHNMFMKMYLGSGVMVSNFLDYVPSCSIPSLCVYINKHLNEIIDQNIYTDIYSKVEYANMVNMAFEEGVRIILDKENRENRNTSIESIVNASVEIEKLNKFGIIETFVQLNNGLSKGVIEDVVKDIYYNERQLQCLITSDRVIEFRNNLLEI